MPRRRQIWNGTISFGLVNVPVEISPATRDLDYHFRQIHQPDLSPVEQRRFCSEEDVEVSWDEIGRGFELDDGRQVVLTGEELEAAQPEKSRTIEIESFVGMAEVDPIFFDHPYYLVPKGDAGGTLRAYQLLVRAMESTGRMALGRFVMRTKEYLAGIHAREGALALSTMRFHDEVRATEDVPTGGKKPEKRALKSAVAIIEELSVDWDPTSYTDCYRERLSAVIESKEAGETVAVPDQVEEPEPAPDLMAALTKTLENARGGGEKPKKPSRVKSSSLTGLSKEELYELAQEAGIEGRSKMSKKDLVDALS